LGQENTAGFVKADRDIQLLAFFPERVVVGVAPHLAIDMVRPHEDAFEAQLFDAAPGLLDGRRNVVRRNDAGAEHTVRRDFAKIIHPIVVGLGDGGG
jgi:hypothetical protein